VLRGVTIRTSFMRWSQAWMLLALLTFCEIPEQAPADAPADNWRPDAPGVLAVS
jgi:hypothetical protein